MTRLRVFFALLVVGLASVAGACGSDGRGDGVLGADAGGVGDGSGGDDGHANASADGAMTASDAGAFDGGASDSAADASADSAADAARDASLDSSALDATLDAIAEASSGDASGSSDSGDASVADGSVRDGSGGVITGGPCLSGAPGATAFRIRFVDAGGQAVVQYEVDGLPDKSNESAGAYGYQIGFTPAFVDPFLGAGGLQLDDSDFVDLKLSTRGVPSIARATLAIDGRSYSVDTNGSFSWQTLVDTGATSPDFVSNVAPYQWYAGDATSAVDANDSNMMIRIKAGPSSDALVVNRIELCIETN